MSKSMRIGPGSCHTTISARDTDLRNPAYLRNLRNKLLPAFIRLAGIKNISKRGIRMVIDVQPDQGLATIHLMAGPATPNPCPQDWTATRETKWDPKAPNFFQKVAAVAKTAAKTTASGTKLFYPDAENEVFGIESGDPKTDIHFLMLSMQHYDTLADAGFSERSWLKFFDGAYQILRTLGVEGMPARYVANFGMGFQATARLHMHVHVQRSPNVLPSLDPKDYGLEVNDDGSVRAPANASTDHIRLVALINKWKETKGFGAAEIKSRIDINKELHPLMEKLRIK